MIIEHVKEILINENNVSNKNDLKSKKEKLLKQLEKTNLQLEKLQKINNFDINKEIPEEIKLSEKKKEKKKIIRRTNITFNKGFK